MFKGIFKGVTDTAERAAHSYVALMTSAVLILALFAVAHLISLMYPPSDGKANNITKIFIGTCMVAILLIAGWAVYAVQT